jgi:hypothetical protein
MRRFAPMLLAAFALFAAACVKKSHSLLNP